MTRAILAACLLLALSGCTVIQSAQYAVSRYCALPEQARHLSRQAVARAMVPSRIAIECAEAGL